MKLSIKFLLLTLTMSSQLNAGVLTTIDALIDIACEPLPFVGFVAGSVVGTELFLKWTNKRKKEEFCSLPASMGAIAGLNFFGLLISDVLKKPYPRWRAAGLLVPIIFFALVSDNVPSNGLDPASKIHGFEFGSLVGLAGIAGGMLGSCLAKVGVTAWSVK